MTFTVLGSLDLEEQKSINSSTIFVIIVFLNCIERSTLSVEKVEDLQYACNNTIFTVCGKNQKSTEFSETSVHSNVLIHCTHRQ